MTAATQHVDRRSRRHAAWGAFLLHRLSGLALAVFLPLHFLALGLARRGDAALGRFLAFTDAPLVKSAEWGLVVLLALHLGGGLRLLLIEFGDWNGLRKDWIAGALAFAGAVGLAYALALIG
jgi:fumarate reductase subunit D